MLLLKKKKKHKINWIECTGDMIKFDNLINKPMID